MSRILLAIALLFTAGVARAQDELALEGRLEGSSYVSPTGIFSVKVPVLPELGGEVTDTATVVTFRDAFNLHVSIAAFPQDATQRWELSTRGTKDYLAYFFANYVLSDFQQNFEGVRTAGETKFVPTLLGGALLAFIEIPGGSMFMERYPRIQMDDAQPVAKRGNLLFVRDGHIFLISSELAERITEPKSHAKSAQEEDQILRLRLEAIASTIVFRSDAKPAASKK